MLVNLNLRKIDQQFLISLLLRGITVVWSLSQQLKLGVALKKLSLNYRSVKRAQLDVIVEFLRQSEGGFRLDRLRALEKAAIFHYI